MRRSVRAAARLGTVALLGVVLASCGGYYYTATVQGFVRDSSDDGGVNGVTVRFYEEVPEAADSEGFFAETSTTTSGGSAGFYSNRVIWRNAFGRFGAEGDTGTVHLGLSHPDYASQIVEIPAVLSDTTNTVRDVLLERLSFEVPVVRGQVIDTNGDGVNGVRMVLDLASTTDETEDYVTTTATVDGQAGTYEFDEVSWIDEAASGESSDDETITITVDDNEYESSDSPTFVITSGVEREIESPISVTRIPQTEFAATVQGSTVFRVSDGSTVEETPIAGVVVTLTFTDDEGATTLETVTNAAGNYQFFVEWTDDGTTPDPADANAPTGENALSTQIEFDATNVRFATDIDTGGTPVDFIVRSWVGQNVVPDRVDTTPQS